VPLQDLGGIEAHCPGMLDQPRNVSFYPLLFRFFFGHSLTLYVIAPEEVHDLLCPIYATPATHGL